MAKYLYRSKRLFKKITTPKKKGISWWRHVFTGLSAADGSPASVFIEYIAINPSLSPDVVIRSCKVAEDAIQITSLQPAKRKPERPSYIMTRAGLFGRDGIIFENVLPSCEEGGLRHIKTENKIAFNDCILSDNTITGIIEQNSVIYSLFSDSTRKDLFLWDITAKETALLNAVIAHNKIKWKCTASKTPIQGNIQINEETYSFSEPAFCYFDKLISKEIPSYWFSIAGAHIVSKITNKRMETSCFVVQGFSADKINIFLALEHIHLAFKPGQIFSRQSNVSCVKNEENIHWTVSAQDGKYMLDIDIFCAAEEMKLRNYDSPDGNGIILSLLTGATGSGEIRLYRRLKNGLELIEHADVENALCEFGGEDTMDADS
jgi:hypothetical protein